MTHYAEYPCWTDGCDRMVWAPLNARAYCHKHSVIRDVDSGLALFALTFVADPCDKDIE
jgi:hypothetical protein